jgi:Tat protein translocase TatB subunit
MEILVILVVALVVLGPTRLPEAGRQVGRAMGEFRKWSSSVTDEIQSVMEPRPTPAPVRVAEPMTADETAVAEAGGA